MRTTHAPDRRIDEANRHAEGFTVASGVTGHTPASEFTAFHSFLAGWDAAMEQRFPELLAENHALHERLLDLEQTIKPRWAEGACRAEVDRPGA